MTTSEQKELQAYRQAKAKRKVQVKKYFARRAIRLQVCEAYFNKNASKEEKANLENKLKSL